MPLQPAKLRQLAERVIAREVKVAAQIDLQIPPELLAMAEPDLLTRALANVVRNAVRYAGAAGPITISAREQGGCVLLNVADLGAGVPPESLDKLFDPFYRPDTSRSSESGGTGLGLAIVKSCVDACRGSVSCRNRAPRGFEVEISLESVPT